MHKTSSLDILNNNIEGRMKLARKFGMALGWMELLLDVLESKEPHKHPYYSIAIVKSREFYDENSTIKINRRKL